MNKNIIITGGLGQDGQILTKILNYNKNKIFIFARSKRVIDKDNIKLLKQNLFIKKKIDKFFKKIKPDIVLHLASNNPSFNEKNYKLFYEENLLATKNIFLSTFQANKKAKFVFCSSSKIFRKKSGVVNEKSKKIASSDYTKFRIKSNEFMLKYKKRHKINYTNAILFNHDSLFRNKKFLLPRLVNFIIKKDTDNLKKIIMANIVCDFSHAEDICNGLKKIIFSKFNEDNIILSSGKSTHVNEIIKFIINKNKININLKLNKEKNIKCLVGNNKLAKKLLNWKPRKNIFIAANEIYKNYIY